MNQFSYLHAMQRAAVLERGTTVIAFMDDPDGCRIELIEPQLHAA